MLKKYISTTQVGNVPQNGIVQYNGEFISISNLPNWYEKHMDIANQNSIYTYIQTAKPTYDEETEYLELTYSLTNNEIHEVWTVKTLPTPEPTEIQLAQQDITDLQIADIEHGQNETDIQLELISQDARITALEEQE